MSTVVAAVGGDRHHCLWSRERNLDAHTGHASYGLSRQRQDDAAQSSLAGSPAHADSGRDQEFGEISLDHALAHSQATTRWSSWKTAVFAAPSSVTWSHPEHLYRRREAGEVRVRTHSDQTSGLADPAPVAQAFLSEPTLAGLVRLAAVLTIIDSVNSPGRWTGTTNTASGGACRSPPAHETRPDRP